MSFANLPVDYSPTEFFSDYISSLLPPIYLITAKRLESKHRVPFVASWAWESGNLIKDCGLSEELGEFGEYMGGPREPSMLGCSTRLSEVYRSAFIRTLAWFHFAGCVTDEEFIKHSMMTCPVDLSLWEINTAPPPEWWPRLDATTAGSQKDVNVVELSTWSPLRDLVTTNSGVLKGSKSRLLAVAGICLWKEDRKPENTEARFSLVAFAYKTLGPLLPSPEPVGACLLHSARWLVYPELQSRPCVLDTKSGIKFFAADEQWTFDDLTIYPLVFHFETLNSNFWQWFRGYNPPFGLSPHFARMKCIHGHDRECWYYTRNRRRVAIGRDWRLGPLERLSRQAFPLHGQFLEIESGLLDKFLTSQRLRLAYHLRVEIMTSKYRYDEPKEHSYDEFINLGRVITEED
jgi:hypothetical protein